MRLADFDFDLPPDRIAQHPARPRDAARLLHVARDGLADRMVRDLPMLLRPGDVLVANDTRVIPAQLTARRGDARIGITLDQPRADGAWHALARNARRLHVGDELRFDGGDELRATVVERDADGGVVLAFNQHDAAFAAALRHAGALALPPYIARPAGPLPEDSDDYQTIFAAARRRGGRADRRACISRRRCSTALERRGVQRRHRHAACRRRHVPAGAHRRHRAAPHACRTRRDHAAGRGRDQRRAQRRRWSRWAPPACACWKPLRRRMACVQPFAGDTDLFIRAGLPVSRRRSAADQLPPAALDAVHAGLRLRRHRADARGLCACDRGWVSVLLLWRRVPAGARRDATPLPQGEGEIDVMAFAHRIAATDGAARAGVLHTAHGEVPTPAFMPVGTAGTVKAMTADAVRATGARHRPGQHLPPDAAPRRRAHRAVSAGCTASWTGPDRS